MMVQERPRQDEVRLFNVGVFMPKFNWTPKPLALRYGPHALNAARDDRYGNFEGVLPKALNLQDTEIVEVEVTGKSVTKLVCRVPGMKGFDLVMVVQKDGFVKTVWANDRTDKHRTLDRTRYATKV